MHEQGDQLNPETEENATSDCGCGYMRVARIVIGTLLLTVMVGNLLVYASPEWAATIGSFLGGGRKCSSSSCSASGCCPTMTSIGLPGSVLESAVPSTGTTAAPESQVDEPH